MRTLTLLVCLVLLLPPCVSAASSTITPADSPSAAIARLQPGDTLTFKAGVYTETLNSFLGTRFPSGTSWSHPITIKGEPGAILRPSSGEMVLVIANAGYLVFDGLTFDGSKQTNTVVKLDDGSHHIRLQNVTILGNAGSNGLIARGVGHELLGVESSGNAGYGMYILAAQTLIDSACIHHNHGYGIHIYDSGHSDVSNNTVRNSTLYHNGWDNHNPAGSCALLLSSGSNNVAEGNTVADQNGCGIQVYYNALQSQVRGNRVSGTTGAPIQDEGRGTVQAGNTLGGAMSAPACGTWRGTRPAPTHLRAVAR